MSIISGHYNGSLNWSLALAGDVVTYAAMHHFITTADPDKDKESLLHFFDRLSVIPYYEIKLIPGSEDLDKHILCWLVHALYLDKFPTIPDQMKGTIAKTPEFYGQVIRKWCAISEHLPRHRRFNPRQHLLPVIKRLVLEGENIRKFGIAFTNEFNPQPTKENLDYFLKIIYDEPILVTEPGFIKFLSSALVYEGSHSSIAVEDANVAENETFNKLPHDIQFLIFQHLSPDDLQRVAMACRKMFNLIAKNGQAWRDKSLGCIGAYRNMIRLSCWIEREIELCPHWENDRDRTSVVQPKSEEERLKYLEEESPLTPALYENLRTLQRALFFAWPASLALQLGRVDQEGLLQARNSPLVKMYGKSNRSSFPDVSIEIIEKEKQFPENIFLTGTGDTEENTRLFARFFHDNPENFSSMEWWKVLSELGDAFECLAKCGLPWHALEPFCEGIRKYWAAKKSWSIHFEYLPLLQRIRSEFPYFDLENSIPKDLFERT